jgi:hypothetical protein
MQFARLWVPAIFLAVNAAAYVPTTSDHSAVPVKWMESCITVRPDTRGSQDLPLSAVEATLRRAVNNWRSRTDSCSYLALQAGNASFGGSYGIDGRPTVVFRDQRWADPRTGDARDSGIIALTTVFYVDTPGLLGDASILDADVELNGVYYTFTNDAVNTPAREGTAVADLENTLTHELGHVQGLGHTCWDHVREFAPLDNLGQPIPDCSGPLPPSILETTMYPYPLEPGETSKRHLAQDDVDGICQPYPASALPPSCQEEIDGGCDISPHAAPTPWPLLLLLALLVVRRPAR